MAAETVTPPATSATRGAIVAAHVGVVYPSGSHRLEVLRDVSFAVEAGGSVVILGPSGSGKSTLLHVLGSLERPTSGRVSIDGFDPSTADDAHLARFRNQQLGFVFQDHHLLPQFSVWQNVMLPGVAGGRSAAGEDLRARARELLVRVGLGARLEHRPGELSGGERQRGAIARALVNRPSVLLCDEPTGNLDRKTAESVADLLFELQAAEGSSLVAVTHSQELAARFPRRLRLEDGVCSPA